MRLPRESSFSIQIFGYLILAIGVFGTGLYCITKFQYSLPQDMGIVLGNGAIMLLGCVSLAVAKSLKKLERRLDQLEGTSGSAD